MRRTITSSMFIVLTASAGCVHTAAINPHPLSCLASITRTDEPRIGGWPYIRLEIANTTAAKVRVLDIWRKPDLWCPYSDFSVLRDGKSFDRAIIICDPGPLEADDFILLRPGESRIFVFNPASYTDSLLAGEYTLQVTWWFE